jgi:hypothetical protein
LLETEAQKEEQGIKINTEETETTPMDNNEVNQSASYEHIAQNVLDKMQLLLRLAPVCEVSGHYDSMDISQSHSMHEHHHKRARMRSSGEHTSLRNSQDDHSLHHWQEMFFTWKALQQAPSETSTISSTTQNIASKKTVNFNELVELVNNFTKKANIELMDVLIQERINRANNRARSIHLAAELLKNIRFISVQQDIIQAIGHTIRNLKVYYHIMQWY